MEQFDNWHKFWDNFLTSRYGKESVETEDDLYFQVARTVNRKPVEKHVFDKIIEQIIDDLAFQPDDVLVDFCCGNGLFTYELKDKVKRIIGVDFSQNIIDTANKFKAASNITYCLGDVVGFMKSFKQAFPGIVPGKYLMNDSLAYFSPTDLEEMLKAILAVSPAFKFLTRGVPNDELKWNYYNTEERKQVYYANIAKGDTTNDGLGRWWVPGEIKAICDRLQLKCYVRNQQMPLSDYRMDVMITN
jgi:hypothetical protein